eukprot:12402169-Karenia_brevis.AAC.1
MSPACFLPKNDENNFKSGVAFRVESVRLIGNKNGDFRAGAAAINYAVSDKADSCCAAAQRECIKGRDFTLNVLQIDAQARVLMQQKQFQWSILALWDIAAACPSFSDKLLYFVMKFYGLPA